MTASGALRPMAGAIAKARIADHPVRTRKTPREDEGGEGQPFALEAAPRADRSAPDSGAGSRTLVGAGSAARQLRATAVSPARHYLPIPAPALLAKASPAGSLGDFQNHAEFRRGAQIAGVPIEGRDLPEEGARGRGPGYSPRGAHKARPNSLRVIGGRSRNLLMRACSSIGGRAEVVCGSIRPARSG